MFGWILMLNIDKDKEDVSYIHNATYFPSIYWIGALCEQLLRCGIRGSHFTTQNTSMICDSLVPKVIKIKKKRADCSKTALIVVAWAFKKAISYTRASNTLILCIMNLTNIKIQA